MPQSTPSGISLETKVYYFLDDSTTPYVSVIPTPSDIVTLADFKNSFTKRGYQYFCKELDPDFGCEVKIELTDDNAPLRKNYNGLIELYLLSLPGYATLPRAGTLPRKDKISMGIEAKTTKERRRRSVELDRMHFGMEAPSSSQAASSMGGTIISRRAGEHLAELYTSNSEDPYRFDESSRISGMSSSLYEPLAVPVRGEKVRKRKPRKERFRKAYVPSTIGSATGSSMSQELDRILEVHLSMRNVPYLGISVVSYEGSILVSEILPDGAVSLDGRIDVGDQIIQVNTQSFENLSDSMSVRLLREVAAAKRPLTLFVAKKPSRSAEYDPLANLASETLPLDISLWVQTAAQCSEKERRNGELGLQDTSQTFDDGTLGGMGGETDDEEERELYDQRRNGIPRNMLEDAERRRENEQNEHQITENLSVTMDPVIVVRALARQDSGLQVKNRKWLKILVPMSFIGRDLVDWLMEHLTDVRDRKAARQYASHLLECGLIRHVVSKLTFTEKCYYVFGDAIIGVRGAADNSQNSGGTLRAEATTEVTYVGSPAPPGMAVNRHPLQMIPAPLADQTWPISPITVFDKTGRAPRRMDCESPMTNDYASMIGESTTSYGMGIGRGYQMNAARPNTPLRAGMGSLMGAPPHPSPCETEFEDDDKRRIIKK